MLVNASYLLLKTCSSVFPAKARDARYPGRLADPEAGRSVPERQAGNICQPVGDPPTAEHPVGGGGQTDSTGGILPSPGVLGEY